MFTTNMDNFCRSDHREGEERERDSSCHDETYVYT